jgi:hypothetical protein
MICYLPFTHFAPTPFQLVAQALGPVSVFGPSLSLVPEPMRGWQEQGLLDLRIPAELDPVRFLDTLEAYKDWARLHDGHIGDMIQFYTANQGRPPLLDEAVPSQISTRIRHFGEAAADKGPDPMLQAALFLALAQEYDQHQERLHRDLGAVMDMERAMYTRMGSDADGVDPQQGHANGTGNTLWQEDPGAYMTHGRLQAWARMALSDARPSWIYVTPSAAVFDYLKGLWSEFVELATWHLNPQAKSLDLQQQRRAALQEMGRATDLGALSFDPDLCGRRTDDAATLEIVGLPGSLLDTLLPGRLVPEGWRHTLIGWVGSPQ